MYAPAVVCHLLIKHSVLTAVSTIHRCI